MIDNLSQLKRKCLVFDIETSSFDEYGNPINLRTQYEKYIQYAKVKWFGAYSYKNNKQYYFNALIDTIQILNLLKSHEILIGFNSEEFDYPILENNGYIQDGIWYTNVDCMQILGRATKINRKGFKYKDRGSLMKLKFKKTSLEHMAKVMKLNYEKSKIDYKIFEKEEWTEQEVKEIKKYLSSDVMITKQMFDKLWDFWLPFTKFLDKKNIENLSWIRNSIASLTYKSACFFMNTQPTYGTKTSKKEEMGGRVIEPKYEEKKDVWYIDFSSLYPHIFCMFNLFAEKDPKIYKKLWHGNNLFQVKGYYDVSKQHILALSVKNRLKERIDLQKNDKSNPLIYALKIWLNCFSSDTKVIMADGQEKLIKDCAIGEKVYSINPKTLKIEQKEITKIYEYDYIGDMHHYIGHYFDFNVTPNHKFLLQHKNNKNNINFYKSESIESQYKIPIHKSFIKTYQKNIDILNYLNKEDCLYSIELNNIHGRTWLCRCGLKNREKKYNCNDRNFIYKYETIKDKFSTILNNKYTKVYLRSKKQPLSYKIEHIYNNKALSYLIGIYLAEGSLSHVLSKKYKNGNIRGDIYSVNLSQNKIANPKIYQKIINALDICNLKYSTGKQSIKISGNVFYTFILKNFGKLKNKHIKNKELWNVLNLKMLFQGLIDGDGSKKSCLFTTKYDYLKQDFINLCLKLGYTFTIKNDGYWRIIYNNNANSFRKTNRRIEKYNGKVYCLEIKDNHTLLAGKNGKYNWSGNSLYGVVRSSIFEKVHTPNAGWDCCWLGQQIHEFTERKMKEFGFEIIAGDSVAKDTPVLIKFNNQIQIIPIEDLFIAPKTNTKKQYNLYKKNIQIWTDKGWTKIKHVYRHKTKKMMYRIVTRKGFIEVSEDHSLIINNKPVSPNKLNVGDNLELIDYDLENKYKIDKDLCWLLGFWLAEGSTGFYKYKSSIKYCWALYQKKLKPLKKAQKILLKYGLNTKILNTLTSSNCNKLVPNTQNIKVFYELFKEWCLTKTNTKKIPSFILSANISSKQAFLKGYLEGDGSIDKYDGSIHFCSVDKSLFSGLCKILKSLGKDYSLKIRKDKPNILSARILINPTHKNINLPNKILKIETHKSNDFIYDIETENHHFCGGIGNVNLHNTDSLFMIMSNKRYNTKEYVQDCLNEIIEEINKNVPFPTETFQIKIEHYLNYIMWAFSEQPVQDKDGNNLKKSNRLIKKRKGKKKNYLYVYEEDGKKKIELVGLPIMKDNATHLGIKIYEEVLKDQIIKNNSAKFDKSYIEKVLNEYLERPEIMKLMAREYKVNSASSYKLESQIQAQISKAYFNGKDGTIELIKNNKIGKVGIGQKYCTVDEAIKNKLNVNDVDLEKVWNELDPFIKHVETKKEKN